MQGLGQQVSCSTECGLEVEAAGWQWIIACCSDPVLDTVSNCVHVEICAYVCVCVSGCVCGWVFMHAYIFMYAYAGVWTGKSIVVRPFY